MKWSTFGEAIRENKILLMVACMFVLLDVLVWLNEVLDLPYLLLGGPRTPFNWHEATANTIMITAVGLLVVSILILYISKRKQAEERVVNLNAVLRAIRKVSQLIVKVKDRGNLLQGICESFIETRGCYSSWIVFIKEDSRFITASHAGVGDGFQTMIDKLKSGQMTQCMRQAGEQPGVVVVTNPAIECGDCPLVGLYADKARSVARLEYEGRVYGFLTVTIPVEMAQDEQERMLFCEAADDIAFALHSIELEEDRKRAEGELKKSEERYRTLVENSTDAILMMDIERRVVSCNSAFLDLFGYSKGEIEGKSIRIIHQSDESFRSFGDTAYPVIKKVGSFMGEWEFVHKDGTILPVETVTSAIKSPDGSITGYVAIIRDITERKEAEEEKEKLEEQLRQAQKMEAIGTLAGGIAHDFNNILTIIIGNAELLSMSLGKDNPLQGRVEEISKGGERAASLTRQLLAFSRRQMLQPQVLDLNGVIPNMDKMLRRLIGEDIDLETFLAPELGRVEADPGQIEQVIMNLAVNARDAMPTGGKLTIETANVDLDETYAGKHVAVKPGPYVMMAISDSGKGMDEETRSNIFEPFFTTKEKGRGTGLGLSTIYGIVKQSGGNIWVYSEPEKGTTFKIYLPRVEKVAETAEKVKATAESLTGSETIMVVEDDKMVRDMAKSILQQYGYSILDAQDGKEAIRVSKKYEGPIQLMLTDVVMPGISGRVLAERLAVQRPKMKVLYMSGYTDNAIVRHGVLDKEVILIQKPFTVEALAKKVREVLDS